MKYIVTLLESSGYTARSHWGVGTFLVNEPREVDLSPEYADSLRVKGYRVELAETREVAPQGQLAHKGKKLAEKETEREE